MAPRFANLDGSINSKGLGDVLRWKLGANPAAGEPDGETPWVANDGSALVGATRPALTWVGHATFLVQLGGVSILTDPIYAERLVTVKRHVASGLSVEALPKIDVVVITHNHRDHMDAASIERIAARARERGDELTFVVPKGLGSWFEQRKVGRVVELGWWETHAVGGSSAPRSGAKITFVPSQHWSQRGAFDRNQSLWGGYVFEEGVFDRGPCISAYHSGDTAYFEGFRLIGERFPKIDAAMLPIGAYEPRWFMKQQHMNPDDALKAFVDLGAARFVAMHWGTYKLTDEPLHAPPELLRELVKERGIDAARISIPAVGETVWLDGAPRPDAPAQR